LPTRPDSQGGPEIKSLLSYLVDAAAAFQPHKAADDGDDLDEAHPEGEEDTEALRKQSQRLKSLTRTQFFIGAGERVETLSARPCPCPPPSLPASPAPPACP
jgi:hypothetical protein